MARVFRHEYTTIDPKTGERVSRKTKKWYVEYVNADGVKVRIPGYVDRGSTDAMAVDLEREAERIRSGLIPRQALQNHLSLGELLETFERSINVRGTQPGFARETRRKIERIANSAQWSRASSISIEDAERWLSDRMGKDRKEGGLSARTCVHYISALKMFGEWLVPKYLSANPFAKMEKPEAHNQRNRRTLTSTELDLLLETTRNGPTLQTLTGAHRALLYETAARTGFRALELSRLTPESFDIDSPVPTVSLPGSKTKNGEFGGIPLSINLASRLRVLIESTPPGGRVFPGPWVREPGLTGQAHRTAAMVRSDLKRAGIPFADATGRVFDFHALRAQFATDLARAGVPLQITQKLMRHSNPKLTSGFYTLLDLQDLASEIGKLLRNQRLEDHLIDGAGI